LDKTVGRLREREKYVDVRFGAVILFKIRAINLNS
jgi:hypothetical protein